MIHRHEQAVVRQGTIGDLAVDGLFAGLGAGAAMAVYLVLAGLFAGVGPAEALARFSAVDGASALEGLLSHLAVSSMYGVLFGLLIYILSRRAGSLDRFLLVGLSYGVLLFLVAQYVVLPGTGSPLGETSVFHLAAAHILYGLVIGLLSARWQVR